MPLNRIAKAIPQFCDRDQRLEELNHCIEALLLVRQAFHRDGAAETKLNLELQELESEAEQAANKFGVVTLPLPEQPYNRFATVPVPELAQYLRHFTALRDYWPSGESLNDDADTVRLNFKTKIRVLGRRRCRLAGLQSHVAACSEIVERAADALKNAAACRESDQ